MLRGLSGGFLGLSDPMAGGAGMLEPDAASLAPPTTNLTMGVAGC